MYIVSIGTRSLRQLFDFTEDREEDHSPMLPTRILQGRVWLVIQTGPPYLLICCKQGNSIEKTSVKADPWLGGRTKRHERRPLKTTERSVDMLCAFAVDKF